MRYPAGSSRGSSRLLESLSKRPPPHRGVRCAQGEKKKGMMPLDY